jgi:hypothetical protein
MHRLLHRMVHLLPRLPVVLHPKDHRPHRVVLRVPALDQVITLMDRRLVINLHRGEVDNNLSPAKLKLLVTIKLVLV